MQSKKKLKIYKILNVQIKKKMKIFQKKKYWKKMIQMLIVMIKKKN